MSQKLSDSQLVTLSAAAQRKDRCLVVPEGAKAAVAHKVADRLVKLGLVEEAKAKRGMPVWRVVDGENLSRRLTAAGLAVIKVEAEEEATEVAVRQDAVVGAGGDSRSASTVPSSPPAPRPGTKLAGVVDLLGGRQGATIAELIDATGWLPHTTRAALTGLRHKGFVVERAKRPDGATAYVIGSGTRQAELSV